MEQSEKIEIKERKIRIEKPKESAIEFKKEEKKDVWYQDIYTVFVSNLHYNVTEKQLSELFAAVCFFLLCKANELIDVKLIVWKN